VAFVECLSYDPANESEHLYHLFLLEHAGSWRREVGALLALLEQSIVCIKYGLRDELEPFPSQTTFINSFFVVEFHCERLPPRTKRHVLQLLEAIVKDLLPPNLQVYVVVV